MRPHHARQVADEHARRDAAGRPYDRAPGEVETVARALSERWNARDGRCIYPSNSTPEDWIESGDAQAALDAVRGRSRDDTVTLAEAVEAHREWASRTFADRQEALLTFGDFLQARFGAGRAEVAPVANVPFLVGLLDEALRGISFKEGDAYKCVSDVRAALDAARDDTVPPAEEIAAWLQHIDRLDEIPGAKAGLPRHNPLWDAAEAIRGRFGAGRAEGEPPPAKDPTQ